MKTSFLFLLLIVSISTLNAQEKNTDIKNKQNELYINMTNLIGYKWLDIGYERILNEESSIGIGTLFSLDKDNQDLDSYRTFSITPYYRHFFSKKYARGFFIEGFAMVNSGENEYYTFDNITLDASYEEYTYTDLAIGISAGGKFVSKRGFLAEIYLGVGRNLLGNNIDSEIVGRGGIAIGFQFN
ncbi:MAG: DUF3575 domain-containing protein [Flavobacteriaceae bacterium]|nr:DUF3575 domain-containing protein [Flavobacteriaceae bacterium]